MKHLILLLLLAVAQKGFAQILNGGFENWGTVPGTFKMYPSDWNTLQWENTGQETPACVGDNALTVSAWYAYLATRVIQPFPCSDRPLSFRGCYRYTDNMVRQSSSAPIETDTALVKAIFTKWNFVTSSRDTIGSGALFLHQSLSYSPFVCPINYSNDQDPDTVTIVLDPSLVRRYQDRFYIAYNMEACSFFTVDDLSFSNQPAGVEELPVNLLQLHPNPAQDILTITATPGLKKLVVYDMYGKTVLQTETDAAQTQLDLSKLSAGIYLLKCTDDNERTVSVQRFVKE